MVARKSGLLSYKFLNACIGGAPETSFAATAHDAETSTHAATCISSPRGTEIMESSTNCFLGNFQCLGRVLWAAYAVRGMNATSAEAKARLLF
jgi:hypothetical protein